jgi:glyoxylate/hydroxypyruvate reductase A
VLPPGLPVVRMVEPGIVHGMVEYVTHAVLDLHRDMPAYRRAQQQRQWHVIPVRPASSAASACSAWARSGRRCWTARLVRLRLRGLEPLAPRGGRRALPCRRRRARRFLARSEILVCLLPLTDATRGF